MKATLINIKSWIYIILITVSWESNTHSNLRWRRIQEYYFIHRYENCKAKMRKRGSSYNISVQFYSVFVLQKNFENDDISSVDLRHNFQFTFSDLKLSLSRLVQIQFNFSSSNMQLCPIINLITNFTCGLIHLLFNRPEFRQMKDLSFSASIESSNIWKWLKFIDSHNYQVEYH